MLEIEIASTTTTFCSLIAKQKSSSQKLPFAALSSNCGIP